MSTASLPFCPKHAWIGKMDSSEQSELESLKRDVETHRGKKIFYGCVITSESLKRMLKRAEEEKFSTVEKFSSDAL